MLEILLINLIFLVISTVAIVGFIFLISIMFLSSKNKTLPYVSLMASLIVFSFWVYLAQVYIFLTTTDFLATIVPGLMQILIILASIALFSTPYVVPKIKQMMVLDYLVKAGGILLIGYILSSMISHPPNPILFFYTINQQLHIHFQYFFLVLLSLWSFSAISLLIWSSNPWKRIKKLDIVDQRAYAIHNIGILLIGGGFVVFVLDMILRVIMQLNWFNAFIFGLSRSSIIIGLDLLVLGAIIDPSVLSSMLNLLAFYLEFKRISILVSIFSEKGPEIVSLYGFTRLDAVPPEHKKMELYTYIINTMSVFGMGHKFIEGSAFFPVPFEPDLTGLGLTSWVKDESQKEPRFEGKSFVQVLVAVPKDIEHLLYNRLFWQKELTALLTNIQSREQLQNSKMWVRFVLLTLRHEAISRGEYGNK